MYNAEVGKRIRVLRELKHYTREYMAEKLDISSKYLYEIEMKNAGFSAEVLMKIAKEFNVNCEFIMLGNNNKEIENIVMILNQCSDEQLFVIGKVINLIHDVYGR